MKTKLLIALLLLASFQMMAAPTGAAAASSSQASMGSASKDDVRFLVDGPFSIVSTLSGKCVDADNWGETSDTTIHMYSCNKDPRKGTNQLFKLIPTEEPGEFLIAFTHSNKCLTTENKQNGSRLMQHACDAQNTKQKFSLIHAAELAFYHIQQNGKCVDVKDGNKADHAGIQMWDCAQGNPNQTFSLKPDLSFSDLPDDALGLVFKECSPEEQKVFKQVNRNCAKIYSEMTKKPLIINMNKVSRLVQQGRPLSELHTLLSQADVIEIQNATAAEFKALLPHMTQVTQLKVSINAQQLPKNRLQIVNAIANSPQMGNLISLDLENNKLNHSSANAIANSPHMAKLRTLNLNGNNILLAGATAIANSPHMAKLRSLYLGSNHISRAGAIAIANSPHMGELTSLDLNNNQIDDVGATAIANSPHMGKLTSLGLDDNPIRDAGAIAIANSPQMGKLTSLDLRSCGIGDTGATAIAHSSRLVGLKMLNLTQNQIQAPAKLTVRSVFSFAQL